MNTEYLQMCILCGFVSIYDKPPVNVTYTCSSVFIGVKGVQVEEVYDLQKSIDGYV